MADLVDEHRAARASAIGPAVHEWGRELEPALHPLGRWGSQTPLPAQAPSLSADAVVVALQTMFDPAGAGDIDAAYELRLGDKPFAIRIGDRRLVARQGTTAGAVATIATDAGTLTSVLWHGRSLEDAIADGSLNIDGDRGAARRLLETFSGAAG
jgi:hypothetical protein